jgi:glycosyltransferase involved in cell wall biosynthesis
MPKHIGIDARFYRGTTGGLGRYTRNLVKELGEIDTESRYTILLTPKDEAEYVSPGPNFTRLVVDIPHYSLAEQRRLPKVLKEQNFDLVHFAQFNHPVFYHRKYVVTIHDIIMHLFPGLNRQRSPLRQLAYQFVFNDCQRAEKILVPSQATRRDLVDRLHFPDDKIVVTAEGSETSFRPHSEAEIVTVKKKYNLPERFLIFVSRWEAYKGIPTLLPAFEKLTSEFPDLGLVLCGKPDPQNPEVSRAVEAAKARGLKVITPGFVPDEDLKALYSAANVYVHPSQYEGFGIMILEAFGAGTPVVTSNVSSLPEVAGGAAMLVDPNSSDDIAASVRRILNDPKLAAELRQKGFAQAKKFSWRTMAEQTFQIYQQVLGEG